MFCKKIISPVQRKEIVERVITQYDLSERRAFIEHRNFHRFLDTSKQKAHKRCCLSKLFIYSCFELLMQFQFTLLRTLQEPIVLKLVKAIFSIATPQVANRSGIVMRTSWTHCRPLIISISFRTVAVNFLRKKIKSLFSFKNGEMWGLTSILSCDNRINCG